MKIDKTQVPDEETIVIKILISSIITCINSLKLILTTSYFYPINVFSFLFNWGEYNWKINIASLFF